MKRILIIVVFLILPINAIDYTKKPEVQKFIKIMHYRYGFKLKTLNRWFKSVRANSYIRRLRQGLYCGNVPCSMLGSWDRYSYHYLKRVGEGVYFMRKFRKTLKRAYRRYGIPPEYITAIIGIESNFGRVRGDYFVFDRLTHLAFDKRGRRADFYKKQLIALLRLSAREKVNPKDIRGSSSGAIGLAQFIPSTYKHYAVDFNRDGKTQMNNVVDAIGSIANYFRKHGWRRNQPVAVRVKYEGLRFDRLPTGYNHKYYRGELKGIKPREKFNYYGKVSLIKLERTYYDELWYGAKNFYVITRYNHSSYYAMVVHQLAQKIKREYERRYGKFK